MKSALHFALPEWIAGAVEHCTENLASRESRMRFVLDLARQNIKRQTGGPFAAAIFDDASRMVAVGVNMVEPGKCSLLHAEMVAIALAQQSTGRYDLSAGGRFDFELVTSTEPCAMCLGAIPWSGISRLVCGAREDDARSVGFDEGNKPADWPRLLEARGIHVIRELLRAEAAQVLTAYAETGGHIYNAGGA